jgi:hypothetical protein
LKGLLPGDNIVWQVDAVDDYLPFVEPYCRAALEAARPVVYFRFARHDPVVSDPGVEVHVLRPEEGFEAFITNVHQAIQDAGRGAYYVFDCLSDLAVDWYSDSMLGNFFMLTCPYLYDMETVAYFALRRNSHSQQATVPIANTTQLLLDVYRHENQLYVHPRKVLQRYSPTMHMLHAWQGDDFKPVTHSAVIAEVMAAAPAVEREAMSFQLGVWNRTFMQAQEVANPAQGDRCDLAQAEELKRRVLRTAFTRDEKMLDLTARYLDLSDLLRVGRRMVGTGLIGGKAVGMLLARAILRRADQRWERLLEPHDSFYVGSDVFYTFLVRNGIWWARQKQRDPEAFLEGASMARQRILTGVFSDEVEAQFGQMLDHFGQSPFIVRSSSLLEDNYGNAFAGKYDSVFCVNQGPRHQRMEDLVTAVRTIYASCMSERALTYRAQRGLLDRDEQMALLVQRVSGSVHGKLYFPDVAGVGLSFNPYVWSSYIDPRAGMLRLVFGLGTRAVDRSDDDYTRVVALNAPERRPESSFDEVRQYAQRRVDVLDLEANHLVSYDLPEVLEHATDLRLELFASRDEELASRARERGVEVAPSWVLTFERLFRETTFVTDMRDMLRTLEDAYEYPVDVEFTANFLPDGSYPINLVQCRPLQVKGGGAIAEPPPDLDPGRVLLRSSGAVIGQGTVTTVERVIYVVPEVYGQLPIGDRHQVARLIGKLTHLREPRGPRTLMLIGPGRWGTKTPSLGVPVTFAEINTVSILCEVVAMRDDLVPDVSLGTHFLNELIEMDMLYIALFPGRPGNEFNHSLVAELPNRLTRLLPEAERWAHVIRVFDTADLPWGYVLKANANPLAQRAVCYLSPERE